jgi:hypothetical protein
MEIPSFLRFAVPVVCLIFAWSAAAAPVDAAEHIRDAMSEEASSFGVSKEQAVTQLNSILMTEYHGRGGINAEPDPELKRAYVDGAYLLMNGQSIAGGALIQYLRESPAFARSPIGPAYARFLDGMLQPTADPDDFLHEYMERVDIVRPTIDGLPAEFQRPVELWVMGAIYDDKVAIKAGERALVDAGGNGELVASVRELAAAVAPPAGQ